MTAARRSRLNDVAVVNRKKAMIAVLVFLTVVAVILSFWIVHQITRQTRAQGFPAQPEFTPASEPNSAPDFQSTETSISLSADLSQRGTSLDLKRILNGSQGGYAPMSNLRWLGDKAAQFSSVGIKQIRIDHVFNDAYYRVVGVNPDGSVSYDFSRLDRVLLPLLANGIQPFLALSYTPSALGPSPWGAPDSLEAWSAAVAALIGHYRDLGYSGWGYEVWNEPDSFHWTSGADQYNALYAATARAVKSADPTARVGGASAAYLDSEGNISGAFINFLAGNRDIPVDFFSVHSYTSGNWSVADNARQMLTAAGLPDLPIFITEWNNVSQMDNGPGTGSDTNSSPNGSSYVAMRMYLALDSDVEQIFYFSPAEGFRFDLPYNGDLGLITAQGHKKSTANVFEMYSRMEPIRVTSEIVGPGTEDFSVYGIVTTDQSSATSVLMWNNTSTGRILELDLSGLPFNEKDFAATTRLVSDTTGNGFTDGSLEVLPVYPTPNENAAIVDLTLQQPGSDYTDAINLPPHSVALVELEETSRSPSVKVGSSESAVINYAARASGSSVSATSSLEDPIQGWSSSLVIDGMQYSVEMEPGAVRGWSSSTHTDPAASEAISIDYGGLRAVDTVVLWPRTLYARDSAGFPLDFRIEGSSDGENWTVLRTVSNYHGGETVSGAQVFSFKPTELKNIRVTTTRLSAVTLGDAPQYAFQLAEIESFRLGTINGGFETGTTAGWSITGSAEVQPEVFRSGNNGLRLSEGTTASQRFQGLAQNTTYLVTAYVRSTGGAGSVTLSAFSQGGEQDSVTIHGTQWQALKVAVNSGESSSLRLEIRTPLGSPGAWIDDVIINNVSN